MDPGVDRGQHLSRPQAAHMSKSRARPACSPWSWEGWGLPEISDKNREIKSVLIKSHTGTGGPEGPRHLPTALIVHS